MIKIRKFKLGVLGISGRMGSEVKKLLAEPNFSARLDLVPLTEAEVWLDFSSPDAVMSLVRDALAKKSMTPLVVGATGWTDAQLAELEQAAKSFPILKASNFSLGVLLCRTALKSWSSFPEITDWTVTIHDLHHAKKKDAPSGTALSLREALGREVDIESVREGDAIGRHEVVLESALEKLTLIHEAKSRTVFAEGALETVLRLVNHDPSALPKRLLSLDDLYLQRSA